ncbi:glycine zipper 2TM domain-containing protein [Noviherbaspirillum sp.]|mgnify:CR=1 FL=1|uniref:glycine zipper 2TM domain-containing protein n=1 Tax=Noviherbaspirillum sp. TaxID=1926288 RepID=UPI002FE39D0B
MEASKTTNRIHPLIAGAAISVMLVSLTGVAAITGLIPNSHSTASPSAAITPATAPAVATAATSPAALLDAKDTKLAAAEPTEEKPKVAPAPQPRSYAPRPVQKPQQSHDRSSYGTSTQVAQAPSICTSCGRVESVQAIQQQVQPSGIGMVAGAVLGGVLGNQVGGGNGRKIATVAGAVGGGYAGNEVEKRTRSVTSYQVHVRMENGEVRSFPYSQQPVWNSGDRVRVVNGQLTSRA